MFAEFSKVVKSRQQSIPSGQYACVLIGAPQIRRENGEVQWKVLFSVVEGEHRRYEFWDYLSFDEFGLDRLTMFASAMGMNVTKDRDLEADMFFDRVCLVTLGLDEFEWRGGTLGINSVTGYANISERFEDGDPVTVTLM